MTSLDCCILFCVFIALNTKEAKEGRATRFELDEKIVSLYKGQVYIFISTLQKRNQKQNME